MKTSQFSGAHGVSWHHGGQRGPLPGSWVVLVLRGILWVSELHLVLSHSLLWHPSPRPALRACIGSIPSSQLWGLVGSSWNTLSPPPHPAFLFLFLPSSFLPFFFPPSYTTQSFGKLVTWLIFFLALAPPSAVFTLLKKGDRGTYVWRSPLSSHILQNIFGGKVVLPFSSTFMASTRGKERPVLHFYFWLFSLSWDNRLCYHHVFFWNLSFEASALTFAMQRSDLLLLL